MQEAVACLGQCQISVLKTINHFHKKPVKIHKYCNWQGPQYASEGIFPLSIYLGNHFEFRLLHFGETYVYGYPEAYLGSYQTSMMEYFLRYLSRFGQIGPNIFQALRKI